MPADSAASKPVATPRPSRVINVQYVNPLLESTIKVLGTMAAIDAKPERPTLKQVTHTIGDIAGLIDLKGVGVDGWLAVSFAERTILTIAHNMLKEEISRIDETIVDLVGEITNMITGGSKRIYAELGMDIDLARPSVLVGKGQSLTDDPLTAIVMLPFTTAVGDLHVEFSFR